MIDITPTTIVCQYCLDRQIEPNEAIGLYKKLPICDACLGTMIDNTNERSEVKPETKTDTLEARIDTALALMDEFERLFSGWPLSADETLLCHENFYNHQPPAVANLSLIELEQINSRRKGFLFAVRHKDERWSVEISNLKRKLREEANLTGLEVSRKEVGKKRAPSGESKIAKEKLAKALGLSLDQWLAIEAEANKAKFDILVGKTGAAASVHQTQPTKETTGSMLKGLQEQVKTKGQEIKAKINPFTGRPY
jgi:hypothetical protein